MRNALFHVRPLMHSVNYDQPETGKDKIKYLEEMYDLNVKDFDIIENNYFDVNPDFRAAGTLLPATTETEDFVKVHHASL